LIQSSRAVNFKTPDNEPFTYEPINFGAKVVTEVREGGEDRKAEAEEPREDAQEQHSEEL
jgi:hypothetical protein